MDKKWLRRQKTGFDLVWDTFRRSRVEALCLRLGIDYTEDPNLETEMWAQIGDYLALNEDEFRKKGAGAKEIGETKEEWLAHKAEELEREFELQGKKLLDKEILNLLLSDKEFVDLYPGSKEVKTLASQLSRGRRKLEKQRQARYTDEARGTSLYDEFEELRAQRDNCEKSD